MENLVNPAFPSPTSLPNSAISHTDKSPVAPNPETNRNSQFCRHSLRLLFARLRLRAIPSTDGHSAPPATSRSLYLRMAFDCEGCVCEPSLLKSASINHRLRFVL